MKIKSMTACFGRLDHQHLELQDGLNVIHAPNEGGKSTWCAFIRAMFYGVPTRDRDKKGYLAEKNRYQPWSGAPMEGEMTLEWQGRDITLRRFSRGATPFGGFSAVYTDTQLPVPDLNGQNCGEVLLGVGREVWERSAFVGCAPTLTIDGTPELERRIAALFSSGEEDVSFSQTEARLREWQRRRQHNKSGLIPKLEEELARTDRVLDQLQATAQRLLQIQEQRPALMEQQQELEMELQIHQRLSRRDLNTRYAHALQEQEQVRAQLDHLQSQRSRFGLLPHRDRLRDAQTQLQRLSVLDKELTQQEQELPSCVPTAEPAPLFGTLDGPQAVTRAHADRQQAETLLAKGQRSRNLRPLLAVSGIVLAGGLFVVGLLIQQPLWCVLAALVSILLSVVAPVLSGRAANSAQQQADRLLAQYHAQRPEDITAAAESYRLHREQILRAREDHQRLSVSLAQRREQLDREGADLLAFVRSFAPHINSLSGCAIALSQALELEDRLRECGDRLDLASRRCDDLRAQGAQETDTLEALHTPERTPEQTQTLLAQTRSALADLDQQEAMAKGELLTLGDRTQLEAHREQLLTQLERRRTEYEALSLALESLHQANAALQARFAPELNRRSGQILSALTNGRYTSMSLDREFDACAQSADSLLPRSSLSLSRGTVDQIYLAVRLAVCQLCLPEEDPSPLVLDDALLTFDDQRMALALEFLSRTGRQILLFSCQQRESRLGMGNILSLQS